MVGNKAAGRELWLRATCLAVSIGMHAGLGVLGWQGLESVPADGEPVLVTLVEKLPAGTAGLNRPTPAAPRLKAPSAAPAQRKVSAAASPQAKPAPATDPLCAMPEATIVEAAAETTASVAAADASASVGGDSGGGAAGGAGDWNGRGRGESGAAGGGLIKATPRYETNPLPNYPRLARQNRWEGTVRLRARVSAGGEVESLSLERSSGHAVLDRSALDGVQRWRFIPARQGGAPVACEVSIPVAFRLTEP